MEQRDFSHKGRWAILALIAVLMLLSLIPPQNVGGVQLRRANILSDMVSFDDPKPETHVEAEVEEFEVDLDEVSQQIEAQTTTPSEEEVASTIEWQTSIDEELDEGEGVPDVKNSQYELTPIEIEGAEEEMEAFYAKLLHRKSVRIAFLGDSFVEGDILTADLREQLQKAFGGGGAGFAPQASPLTAFRRTIKTRSTGWTAYNIMQAKKTPEALRQKFFVSGWVCQPQTGASTRWTMTDYKDNLEKCSTARLLFISPRDSRIEVIINDTMRQEFRIQAADKVRQIVVSAPKILSCEMRLKDGIADFVGYGAAFESRGVVVDNYSVRSNNGQALFRTNPVVNRQMDELLGYDLVVLQYGLNIMQQGVHVYGNYARQIEKMIDYVRRCFPRAAVLVLGVSERSVKGEDGFSPMDAIPHMTHYQREAARNSGAAFWATSEAMHRMGGMKTFVQNGWAGKDYTHINYGGGRQIATALCDAIHEGVRRLYEKEQLEKQRQERNKPIVDSLLRERINHELFPQKTVARLKVKETKRR